MNDDFRLLDILLAGLIGIIYVAVPVIVYALVDIAKALRTTASQQKDRP